MGTIADVPDRSRDPILDSMMPVLGETDICASCLTAQGMCSRHARGILPQLKQPSWHRHAHSGRWTDAKEQREDKPQSRHAGRARAKARRRGYLAVIAAIANDPQAA